MVQVINRIIDIPLPFNMIVLVCLIFAVAGVVGSAIKEARKFATHRSELAFRREMVDRGLSVDELERVVAAKPSGKNDAA